LNWNYKTTPQKQLIGQEVDYSRGRGLGGTTAINFCAWTVGPKDDYDEWARRVDDKKFGWTNVKKCLKKIEHLHPEIPRPDMKKYLDAQIKGMEWMNSLSVVFEYLVCFQPSIMTPLHAPCLR
jgi:choline dehydrogenase-like flavoprotein